MRRLIIGAAVAIVLAVVGVRVYYVLFIRCCAPPPVDTDKAPR